MSLPTHGQRLPSVPELRAGDSLEGLIGRIGNIYGLDRRQTLYELGWPTVDRRRDPAPFLDAGGLHTTRLNALHQRTGIPVAALRRATISGAFPAAVGSLTWTSRTAARPMRRTWVHRDTSPTCPQCLAERPDAAQLVWRLAVIPICLRHGRTLVRSTTPATTQPDSAAVTIAQLEAARHVWQTVTGDKPHTGLDTLRTCLEELLDPSSGSGIAEVGVPSPAAVANVLVEAVRLSKRVRIAAVGAEDRRPNLDLPSLRSPAGFGWHRMPQLLPSPLLTPALSDTMVDALHHQRGSDSLLATRRLLASLVGSAIFDRTLRQSDHERFGFTHSANEALFDRVVTGLERLGRLDAFADLVGDAASALLAAPFVDYRARAALAADPPAPLVAELARAGLVGDAARSWLLTEYACLDPRRAAWTEAQVLRSGLAELLLDIDHERLSLVMDRNLGKAA